VAWSFVRLPESAERDLVLFSAPEPNLRWRTFTRVLLDVLLQLGTEALLTIGAVLAPTHHRARVPLRGWATTDEWRFALRQRGVAPSTYEGPTGIATVLSLGAHDRGIPALNMNALTPTYLGNSANPRTSLALLRAVADLCGVRLPLGDLEQAADLFNDQVDQFLANQPELRAEIDRLAPAAEEDPEPQASESAPTGELPGSAEVVRELEDFLKQLRGTEGDSPSDT
jgi:proteasome assembly chaperone (PAC2) family protein